MTAKQLHRYRALCREIEDLEKRIDHERMVGGQASDVVRGSQSEYPYIQRSFTISGTDTQRELMLKRVKEKCCQDKEEILVYIESIEDSLVRQIFRYRHIDGLSWRAVAFRVGGANTEDGVRKMHDRYLRKN